MKRALALYDVYPKVLKAKEVNTFVIEALDYSTYFEEGKKYVVRLVAMVEGKKTDLEVVAKEQKLTITYGFGEEQEYEVRILKEDESILECFSVYTLEGDLYELRPYKGDLHVHTCFSDGKESPEYVVGAYRKAGYDFMAITDHFVYEPSQRAIQAYEGVPIGIALYSGEEVHAPDNPVHIVHIGGTYSVNQLYRENPEQYYAEVNALENTLRVPEEVDVFDYASCLWVYNHIKEAGGLSILAHPHWRADAYNIPDAMLAYQFANQHFDAFELIGGQTIEENNMQTAFYYEKRHEGMKELPVVGNSDSHGTLRCELFEEMKTIAFASSLEQDDLLGAIKAGKSVAVESKHGENYRVYGSYRLTSYTLFLLKHYFPLHDELCYEEGRVMIDYIRGDEGAKESLERLYNRTTQRMEKYFV